MLRTAGFGERAANRIEHDVRAAPVRQLAQPLLQVLFGVIDTFIRPALPRERELVSRRGAGDHACAKRLAEFDCGDADASCRTKHGKRLARLELGAILERMDARAVGDDQAGGGLEAQTIGHAHERADRRDHLFARRPVADKPANTIADGDFSHTFADCLDHAGELGGRRERQIRFDLIAVGYDEEIEEIEPGRLHLDEGLALAGFRFGNVG